MTEYLEGIPVIEFPGNIKTGAWSSFDSERVINDACTFIKELRENWRIHRTQYGDHLWDFMNKPKFDPTAVQYQVNSYIGKLIRIPESEQEDVQKCLKELERWKLKAEFIERF